MLSRTDAQRDYNHAIMSKSAACNSIIYVFPCITMWHYSNTRLLNYRAGQKSKLPTEEKYQKSYYYWPILKTLSFALYRKSALKISAPLRHYADQWQSEWRKFDYKSLMSESKLMKLSLVTTIANCQLSDKFINQQDDFPNVVIFWHNLSQCTVATFWYFNRYFLIILVSWVKWLKIDTNKVQK